MTFSCCNCVSVFVVVWSVFVGLNILFLCFFLIFSVLFLQVQQEVALSRQKEKKELADAVKKFRKGGSCFERGGRRDESKN